ncbi:LCP family protein [Streptomyces sp. NPDC048606]|uniref:LCP family protein n=1 Tax=Streptomyces sp. NPDC048606 TaxID=3154726 RepID=UPI00342A3EEE
MNDPQDPYDPYADPEQRIVGYDPYGRPVYAPAPSPAFPPQPRYGHAPPEAYPPEAYPPQAFPPQQPYEQPPPYAYDHGHPQQQYPQQYQPPQPQQQAQAQAQQWIPQQAAPVPEPHHPAPGPAPVPEPRREPVTGRGRPEPPDADPHAEPFAFADGPEADSEDVIDWLAFTESRTERREEARRRGRNRGVALVVALSLFVVGGAGYLWYTDGLPFLDGPGAERAPAATGEQKRDVIVVHVRDTKRGTSSTALLVDNVTTRQGATVLLPNDLRVQGQDGTAGPLGKAVDAGALGTRESLDTVLGTRIGGTWRLDTPFLERLVDLVGGVETDTDTAVPADERAKTPAVGQGPKQSLTGAMAIAYATHRAQGEPETRQLERTGRVLLAVLRKIPSDPTAAATTVESMGQILDPGLDSRNLGALLSRIGEHAKVGAYRTEVLALKADGGLTDETNRKVVKELLGGSFTADRAGATLRVGLKDATGRTGGQDGQGGEDGARIAAKAALLNAGYGFVDGGRSDRTAEGTRITYQDDDRRDRAVEVAKTLGLPETVVQKAESAVNADVVVTLGRDYKPS